MYTYTSSGQVTALDASASGVYSIRPTVSEERNLPRTPNPCIKGQPPISIDTATFWQRHRLSFITECTRVDGLPTVNYAAIVYVIRF